MTAAVGHPTLRLVRMAGPLFRSKAAGPSPPVAGCAAASGSVAQSIEPQQLISSSGKAAARQRGRAGLGESDLFHHLLQIAPAAIR